MGLAKVVDLAEWKEQTKGVPDHLSATIYFLCLYEADRLQNFFSDDEPQTPEEWRLARENVRGVLEHFGIKIDCDKTEPPYETI